MKRLSPMIDAMLDAVGHDYPLRSHLESMQRQLDFEVPELRAEYLRDFAWKLQNNMQPCKPESAEAVKRIWNEFVWGEKAQ